MPTISQLVRGSKKAQEVRRPWDIRKRGVCLSVNPVAA